MEKKYDIIVIGSGPGGEGASIKLSKAGKSVAVIERYFEVGGGCTHWGTIPSKTLIHVIQQYAELRHSRLFDKVTRHMKMNYAELMAVVNDVVEQQVRERQGFYDRNGIEIIRGEAAFINPQTVRVIEQDGAARNYSADHFIIATGSHPYHPDDVDFNSPFIVDSDTILKLQRIPDSITIYGAGVIGSEYASAFRGMDVKVNLVNTRQRMLEFLDDEISDALSYHMRDEKGILIRQNEEYEQVETVEDGVILHLKTGKKIKSDVLLWANGRSGNSSGIGLETLGITPDHRGNLLVNAQYQTTQPHIYAVGDIVGFPSLASAAYDQGRFVGTHIVDGTCEDHLVKDFPTGIYTTPEISSVGKTERELTEACIPYEVGRSFFRSLARGQITGKTAGMLKILFHRETLELLGIHCFGQNASEIVHIGQAIMAQPLPMNSIKYFMTTTFNYPTMAEAYRVAALNGYNRLF
ncbi:MAG: Si-specific NAD(P)(+) transhydrogenase [Bacteroidetes bacterium]|nr:Si-specific NAD(P)(+) transhydrogenase [Bacteroidota bacterium]